MTEAALGKHGLGVLMLDLSGLALQEEERALLRDPQVGGVILFSRNYADLEQLQQLVADIRRCRPEILIAVDQEGGRVQRLKHQFTRLPPMQVFEQFLANDDCQARQFARDCGWLMAAEVIASGIDFSFAPVLDLNTGRSTVIGNRSFAAGPAQVAALAGAFMEGMHSAGMATTGKHFPGHGSVEADSHTQLPVDERPLSEIRESDLLPFIHCRELLDAVMPAHIVYSRVDDHCAGFSRFWLQEILRGELGFRGIIFSDDLSMAGAVAAGTVAQRVDAALDAGCDMILVCNDRPAALEALQHLHQRQQAANPRLPAMSRRQQWSRAELEQMPRWQSVSAFMTQLAEPD